jgi:hypothetical protein
VLTGVSNATGLRSVLASLDTKQQALVLGHAVPMPVVIKTREYGEQFYKDMGWLPPEERKRKTKKDLVDLFGEAGEAVEDVVAVGVGGPDNVVPFRKR